MLKHNCMREIQKKNIKKKKQAVQLKHTHKLVDRELAVMSELVRLGFYQVVSSARFWLTVIISGTSTQHTLGSITAFCCWVKEQAVRHVRGGACMFECISACVSFYETHGLLPVLESCLWFKVARVSCVFFTAAGRDCRPPSTLADGVIALPPPVFTRWAEIQVLSSHRPCHS